MTTGSLTNTQRAYAAIREALDEAAVPQTVDQLGEQAQVSYAAGLRRAMEIIESIDPDADWGPEVPGRVY
jgi:hypothetical protein